MSRRFKQTYRCRQLRELAQQLRYAPPARKAEQVIRAELLHDEVQPDGMYPPQYLTYRITRHRAEHDDDALLVGAAVSGDLRLLIDELSRSIDMPPGPGEDIRTLAAWSMALNVSRKTLERRRKEGLRWRWFMPSDGAARQVGLTATAVERFEKINRSRAESSHPMRDGEREAILSRAAELKAQQPRLSLHRAAVELAKQHGRSVEAVRKLLEKRAAALFPDRRGPLTGRDKRLIARAMRMGVSVAVIAERFGKSRYTIHRAAQQHRAWLARQRKLEHVRLATFERDDADEVLLGHGLPAQPDGDPAMVDFDDLPTEVQPLYQQPGYAGRTLHAMFVRYNYLKFRAERVRAGFGAYQPRVRELARFESLVQQADGLRGRIARSQLPVVLSVVKRHLLDRVATQARLMELLKIGHGVLFESVESFDPSRPQSFDAYLRNRLQRRLAGETEADAARAHRRVDGAAARRELLRHAADAGVRLGDDA